ncbi:hypothetical protein BD560DRAFT_118400 [Blakeslea trispora]|nr:hypothetical protein BD560DRAFT_118400 [Blakeslea trispora]
MVLSGKKRNAKTQLNSKPTKAVKTQQEEVDGNGLFDNLDEEMDPEKVEDYLQQLEESDQEEEEEESDQEESDQEESDQEEEEEEEEEEKEEDLAPTPPEQQSVAKRFRDKYMTKVTQAFGTDLDQIRQESTLNGPRLGILIDSLEAGIDIFSPLEQEMEL